MMGAGAAAQTINDRRKNTMVSIRTTVVLTLTLVLHLQIHRSLSLPVTATVTVTVTPRSLRTLRGGAAILDVSELDEANQGILSGEDTSGDVGDVGGVGGDEPMKDNIELFHQTQTIVTTAINNLLNSRLREVVQQRLQLIKSKASNVNTQQIRQHSSRLVSNLAAFVLVFLQSFYPKDNLRLTLPALYVLALIGSSCGFYLFLYFITVGYALGIGVPILVSLYVYNTRSASPPLMLSNVHSGLAVLWALRSALFFLYREYVNWPQLHDKVVEVNKMARHRSKVFSWLFYSFLYVALASPCVFRLEAATAVPWGTFGKISIALQAIGILVESIADHQKSTFKSLPGNRNQWCNRGLWKWSTHPNYLGETVFWVGTYCGGLSCFSKKKSQWAVSTLGIVFILWVIRGATLSLGQKHYRKYGYNAKFVEFRRKHRILGPVPGMK